MNFTISKIGDFGRQIVRTDGKIIASVRYNGMITVAQLRDEVVTLSWETGKSKCTHKYQGHRKGLNWKEAGAFVQKVQDLIYACEKP